ncbi:MAG: hypothetical protein PHW00_03050 [Clostridia bacterium]|nr:hypothetical protein [Clostridia bacterium]
MYLFIVAVRHNYNNHTDKNDEHNPIITIKPLLDVTFFTGLSL